MTSQQRVYAIIGTVLIIIIVMLLCVIFQQEYSTPQVIEKPILITATTTVYVATPTPQLAGPLTLYFEAGQRQANTSNAVGYFAGGAFLTYVPDWIVEHWGSGGSNDGTLTTFYPRDIASTSRDFSDIVITAQASTEVFSADWLFENEKKEGGKAVVNAEIFVNEEEDMRIYHIEKAIGDRIEEKYFIDGNGKTGVFEFSSSKRNYYYYSVKVKEFIRGLTLAKGPRG